MLKRIIHCARKQSHRLRIYVPTGARFPTNRLPSRFASHSTVRSNENSPATCPYSIVSILSLELAINHRASSHRRTVNEYDALMYNETQRRKRPFISWMRRRRSHLSAKRRALWERSWSFIRSTYCIRDSRFWTSATTTRVQVLLLRCLLWCSVRRYVRSQ